MEYKRNLRVGVDGYTNQELTLDVAGYSNINGKLGIGSIPTDSSTELYVDGDGYFTGIVTATTFYAGPTEITGGAFADDLTVNTLLITGVSTFTGLSTFISDVYVGGTLYVDTLANVIEDNINLTGIITASQLSTGSTETGINIYQDLITGPEVITIDPTTIGDNTGAVVIKGDLYIEGEQFYVNSTTIELADFNVGIATTVGTNVLLDGAGIGIGSTNIRKTLTYDYSSDSLKSSENFDLDSGKVYKIDEVEVLSSSQLTVPNIYSSGIGTIETLDATTGTIDNLDLDTLRVSGISTFTNGPVFVGSGTSTGTIDQKLQVTGGAYISSNLGIGTTNPTEKLSVTGNTLITGNLNVGVGGTIITTTGIGSVGIGSTQPNATLTVNINGSGDTFTGNVLDVGYIHPTLGRRDIFKVDAQSFLFTTSNAGAKTTFRYGSFTPNSGWVGLHYGSHPNPVVYQTSLSNTTGVSGVNNTGYFAWTSGTYFTDYNSWDLRLYRDDAGILAQRNETNPNTFRIYNTYTSASEYERAYLGWNNNVFQIGVDTAGISTARSISLVGAAGSNTGDTLQPLQINQTWTTGTGIATALTLDVTDTSSASTSNLLDLRVDGSRKFYINKSGFPFWPSVVTNTTDTFNTNQKLAVNGFYLNNKTNGWSQSFGTLNSANWVVGGWLNSTSFVVRRDALFGWTNQGIGTAANSDVVDLSLFRDSANVLAQRNSTNPNTFRVYNTYTSATNFERAQVGWTTDTFIVGTEKGVDGGSPRQLELQTDGTTRVAITTTGLVGIGTTQPTEALEVAGNVKATEFIGIGSQISNITFRQLSDVDGSNLVPVGAGTTTPDYLVIYDPNTDSFRFVDPKTYFGINNDFNPDPIIVDYGTY